MKIKRIYGIDIVSWALAFLVIAVIVLPFLHVVSISLSNATNVLQGKVSFFPRGFTFDSYIKVLENPNIARAYLNSFIYTGTATLLGLALTYITAFPLAQKNLPGRKTVLLLFMITMVFSGGMIPTFILIQSLGLLDTIWSLILPGAIVPYNLFLLKNYIENVPAELYEAATVDGASEYRIMLDIYLPVTKPIMATLAVFIAMATWNNYLSPLLYMSSPDKYPLTLVLRDMLINEEAKVSATSMSLAEVTSSGMQNATVMLSVLPLLILYPFMQRFFIGSIYVGSVKG